MSAFFDECSEVVARAARDGAWTPALLDRVDELVREFYKMPGNVVGGALHVVLDDSNWSDDTIRWCQDRGFAEGDADAVALARVLLAVTPLDRLSLACVCQCCFDAACQELGVAPTNALRRRLERFPNDEGWPRRRS